jgi:hypothetical protein
MSTRDKHRLLDILLRDSGIIKLQDEKCGEVHDRMDASLREHGGPSKHQIIDPHHGEEDIRKWIKGNRDSFWDKFFRDIWGHRDSDFLRVALGHIVLDEYWKKYRKDIESGKRNVISVILLAYDKFVDRGYDKAKAPR